MLKCHTEAFHDISATRIVYVMCSAGVFMVFRYQKGSFAETDRAFPAYTGNSHQGLK